MLTLYGYPNTRSIRIGWMLEELEQDYHYQLIDFAKGDIQSPEYLAINPAGKVPALRDEELVLTESAAIVSYLGDKFGATSLVPSAGTKARGRYEQWCYFALCELEQPLWTITKHKFALPKAQRVAEIFPTASWEFQRALKLFSQGLGEQQFILGDQFSAADILLAQTLFWASDTQQAIDQDNLRAYRDRLRTRPALERALQRENSVSK